MRLLLPLLVIAGACPPECRCDSRRRVYCNDRGLRTFPSGIPAETQILYLQDNLLESSSELNDGLTKLTELEALMIYKNRLTEIPAVNSASLRTLRLNTNKITGISENAFASSTSLRELILDDNLLTTFGISSVSFNGLSKLSILSMNQNSFTEFPPELPGSLSALYLAQNQISFISKRSTAQLKNLTVLNLAENKLSDGSMEESTFVNLRQLKELRLGHNFFSSVPNNLPRSLTELSLIANQIMTLKSACLKSFQSLRSLDIAHNRLRWVEQNAFDDLLAVDRIDLSYNSWTCDCYTKNLVQFLQSSSSLSEINGDIRCGSESIALETITEDQLECETIKPIVSVDQNLATVQFSLLGKESPPMSNYKLHYNELSSNTSSSVLINPEENLQLQLSNGLWQFCILNDFLSPELSLEDCSKISIGFSPSSVGPEVTEIAPIGPEAVMAIAIAIVTVVSIVVLVVFITCRRKQYSQMKYLSSTEPLYFVPKRFIPNQNGTKSKSNPKELTLDASKEFAVTLMLRQPPEDRRLYKVQSDASDVYDTGFSGSSRQDSSLFI